MTNGEMQLTSRLKSGVWEPLSQRTLDDLGRIREASNFNPALNWLAIGDRTVRQRFDYDAGLGRTLTFQTGSRLG